MRLAHLRLPDVVHYNQAAEIQQFLVTRLLRAKAKAQDGPARVLRPGSGLTRPGPDPTILTAQFAPVYTCGRREIGTVSAEQRRFLEADGRASFVEALRGGQTTFHGPGQLVVYPILDLRRHGLSPRDYVCLLEKVTMATTGRWGIRGYSTGNPGVWTTEERKIAALGVHLRRHITSHGVALNVNTDLWWFGRIVACGLEGKETTSFEREGVTGVPVADVEAAFVEEFARRLPGIEGVYGLQEQDVREGEE